MPMVTRCPSCATLFRVTPEQLQARQGQVRCGRCTTIFDGFRELATLPDHTLPDPRQPVMNDAEPAAETAAVGAVPTPVPQPHLATTETAEAIPAPPAMAGPEAVAAAGSSGSPETALGRDTEAAGGYEPEPAAARPAMPVTPIPVMPSTRQAVPASYSPKPTTIRTSAISADESFLEQAHAKPRRSSRIWLAACAVALLVLAAQAAYFYRSEVAASYPALRPTLAQICSALGCSLPLPQRSGLINIEASDLQSVDPARPGLIELTATLRNHAGRDLGYPALDLVLTNTREHTLARRIFLPGEYLQQPGNARAGLAANAETTIRLTLDTGELGAAGFRLDLLPAPAR